MIEASKTVTVCCRVLITSASSLTVFQQQLKMHLFYPDIIM